LVVGTPTNGPVVDDGRERVSWIVPVNVGHQAARDCATSALAWRSCASAAAMVWLETSTCAIRPSRRASPNIVHHLPRVCASRGSAGFQSPASLYAAGVSTGGRT
jgi:hypothetical protein